LTELSLQPHPPELPQTLVDELARGGRMVAPVGLLGFQELIVIDKRADGTIRRWSAAPVNFMPMTPGASDSP